MNKGSAYQLQLIDCNCNDCGCMTRDFDALNNSKQANRNYYAWSYRFRRNNMWNRAKKALNNDNKRRHDAIMRERHKLRLDTSYKSGLSFGNCEKFNKPVSFIPVTCQLETQDCFKHRRKKPPAEAKGLITEFGNTVCTIVGKA